MKKPPNNKINQVKKWLSEEAGIKFAILFGSFAKGTSHPDSDIDLAIELDTPLSAERKLNILQSLGEITDKKIDLIDLKTVGEPLLNQIIQHGKVIKGSKQRFIELSIKNVNMMEDFTPYIRRTLKERREKLLNG
jgi:predicted nucleotidyltransferase